MTNDFHGRSPSTVSLPLQADRAFVRRVVASAGVALLLAGVSSTAFAAPNGSTTANVDVSGALTLTALTPNFVLTGLPNTTAILANAVSMNVKTNSIAGYAVTVTSASDTLDPATTTNPDSIPIGALSVKESSETAYLPLSETAAVTVHSQDTRSDALGDTIVNDFSVAIPFVNEDRYSTVLNYVATTL